MDIARLPAMALGALLAFHAPGPSSRGLHAQQGPELAPPDSIAIHTLWSELDSSWNARDPARFSRFYTVDASLAFVDRGVTLEGRDGIHEFFLPQFGRQSAALRHSTVIRELRSIASGVLGMDGEVRILNMPSEDAPATVLRRFAVIAVMVREPDRWRIHLLRIYQMPATP